MSSGSSGRGLLPVAATVVVAGWAPPPIAAAATGAAEAVATAADGLVAAVTGEAECAPADVLGALDVVRRVAGWVTGAAGVEAAGAEAGVWEWVAAAVTTTRAIMSGWTEQ
jgi:hypothetical protein